MNMKDVALVAMPALVCGALLGYFCRPTVSRDAEAAAPAAERRTKKAPAPTDDAALNRLRRRIKELEKQLAERSAPAGADAAAADETERRSQPSGERPGPPSFGDMRARMEEMRRNDPERYAQMTNRFSRMRQRRLERVQNSLDILASVDVSRLTPRQQQIHESFQDAIARREELREQATPENMEQLSEDERRKIFEEMRSVDHQVQSLAQQEREMLLTKAARDMGVQEDAVKDSVETIKAIYEATQTRGGPGGGHGPGGGPGR
ncbi:MAG: hypothetical protein ACI4Q3_05180 [Kiritimatiellia bacterium]